MASISKIQNALVSATQETTLALANLSFDFSLVKVEAPIEYKGVGAALSYKRRHTAENGSIHVTARRLGSLFESILPDTPSLIQSYGRRASDISASLSMIPRTAKAYGPFQEYVGVDGTSIWAAATSSPCAVAVHLLACMLARFWPPAESVSIWEELIAEQRIELAKTGGTGFSPLKNAVALSLEISRDQVCEWDASARAWLLAADAADMTKTKQKQVMLILENISIPINNRIKVYGIVTLAWKTALTSMDQIIGGTAYSTQDGAVLAALASWHLYPDMVVLGTNNVDVRQHDELIHPGGVLTIGLQTDSKQSIKGLSWSLSLAHLRYYGYPVLKEQSLGMDSSRLTVEELLQVALGCVLGSWKVNIADIVDAAGTLSLLCECVAAVVGEPDQMPWLSMLGRSAKLFLSSSGEEMASYRRLILLGLRNRMFLGELGFPGDVFGLTLPKLISVMKNKDCQKVFLREIIGREESRPDAFVIRLAVARRREYDYMSQREGPWQYHSAIPVEMGQSKRHRYVRWVAQSGSPVKGKAYADDELEETYKEGDIRYPRLRKADSVKNPGRRIFEWYHPPSFFLRRPRTQLQNQPPEALRARQNTVAAVAKRTSQAPIRFEYLNVDLAEAAIFRRTDIVSVIEDVAWSDIKKLLENGFISPGRLYRHMSTLDKPLPELALDTSPLISSSRALEYLHGLYGDLPGATISPRLLTLKPTLGESRWAQVLRDSRWRHSDFARCSAFACIAMCETGTLDLDPHNIRSVMAISSGNSLYIASDLLQDPAQPVRSTYVKRVVGNIGRAGLALLVPPQEPKLPVENPDSWRLINHASFDGKLENCFASTSLHLGFSGYEFALADDSQGGRFTEAFFIEAVVSVHDRGDWVADLDILSALQSGLFNILPTKACCKKKASPTKPGFYLTSIDQWAELLDQHGHCAIVRAHQNWQARLAASVISVKLGYQTFVFSGDPCWKCGLEMLKSRRSKAGNGDIRRTTVGSSTKPNPIFFFWIFILNF
ncbi:hypothetical protein BDR22DRAFT_938312 [Usnea florida]